MVAPAGIISTIAGTGDPTILNQPRSVVADAGGVYARAVLLSLGPNHTIVHNDTLP